MPERADPTPIHVRLLLTGHTGYLGHHLVAALRARGAAFVTGGRSAADVPLDLDDLDGLRRTVERAQVDVVLHAAARSAMGACAADPAAAMRCNGDAVGALARAARVVFVSTDLVFDGDAAPYGPSDAPRPASAYGRSKVHGEELALAAGGVVVRVPLLLGPSFDGRHGATDMLRAARDAGRRLGLFTDEHRTPLHVADAARALVDLALGSSPRPGVRHLAGPERVSRWELAERFAARHRWDVRCWDPVVADDPTRPRDVSMVSEIAFRPLDAMLDDA